MQSLLARKAQGLERLDLGQKRSHDHDLDRLFGR
jgi:hypothetical protein